MRIALLLLALVAAAVALTESAGSTASRSCSAAGLASVRPIEGLPKPVASIRLRVAAAAIRCDYAALERLADEHGRGLEFSFGAERSASAYWRRLEAGDVRPKPMEALVKILKMPFVHERSFYSWPSAYQRHPNDRDWQALRSLYTRSQIAAMRRSDIGYFGYRAGFTPTGDWQLFVTGD